MSGRARYGFMDWTLLADPETGLRYAGECLDCGERSINGDSADDAQLWCLKHAGMSGDKRFKLTAFQSFDALPSGALGPRAT
ncbi:DUF7848 domain-containing protein [Streptomyces sp. NBC_01210]|uniref:DUF7848 domain-containing protein n=1 Tax=Streptomyces sp. NBC_01210 TaxID=2903774 RepID=UPI003FA3DD97